MMNAVQSKAVVGFLGSEWNSGAKRSTLRKQIFWVKSVSWDGDVAKKVTTTTTSKRDEACELRAKTAEKLARFWKLNGYFTFVTVK